MHLLSHWKLTHDPTGTPVVILDYEDEIQDEPTISLRRGLNVIEIPYGTPFLQPTAQDVYEVSLTIIKGAASDALARRDMLAALTDRWDQLAKKPLRLEIRYQTDRYHQWASAFFTTAAPRLLVTDGPANAWALPITFTAVSFTKTII